MSHPPEQPESGDAVSATSAILNKYRTATTKMNMTLEESIRICEHLADEVTRCGVQYDAIVGIANGALLPTRVIADRLAMPCEFIRLRRQGSSIKSRLSKVPGMRTLVSWLFGFRAIARTLAPIMDSFNKLQTEKTVSETTGFPGDGRVLLVDDAIDSGQSIVAAQQLLLERGASVVHTVVMTWSDSQSFDADCQLDEPEYWLNRRIQHYPWSGNNPMNGDYKTWLARHDLAEWD